MLDRVVEVEVEPAGFDVDDAVWDRGAWLDDLRDVPDDAWWPRLMTVPHPAAAGSLGVEFVEWVRVELGIALRWWQRLFATRLLEVDAGGVLVWSSALLTLARQCGKSLLVYCLCDWRSEQASRFGEPQLVLHTADTLEHAKAVWQRAHRRVAQNGWPKPRLAAGEYQITKPDGLWLVRSQTGVVGYTASLAVADECHNVKAVTVDQGLSPTTVEAAQGQLLLVSTAHSASTDLFPDRRAAAIARLGDPGTELLVEWSAPRGTSVTDPVARRQGSPHWHPRRAAEIAAQAERAAPYETRPFPHELVVAVRTQWHNEWRRESVVSGKGDPLVAADVWAGCGGEVADDRERIVVAVEDHGGLGAAIAAVVVQGDGRLGVDGWTVATWVEALTDLRRLQASHDGFRLWAGASIMVRLPPGLRATAAGTSTLTRSTLPLMRELAAAGQVVHDSVELDEQVDQVRVVDAVGGLAVVPGVRSDLLRAASWALAAAHRPRRNPTIR